METEKFEKLWFQGQSNSIRQSLCNFSLLAAFKGIRESGHLDDHLFIQYNYQKIYLLHDAEYLIKNVTNNLLNYTRFIFPAFEYDGFEDPVSFKGGQTSWKLYHDVFQRDTLLEANLRKAPK